MILLSICGLCGARLGPLPWYIQIEEKPHSVEDLLFERELELSRAIICMGFGISPDMEENI
jgi:hypothetical protein